MLPTFYTFNWINSAQHFNQLTAIIKCSKYRYQYGDYLLILQQNKKILYYNIIVHYTNYHTILYINYYIFCTVILLFDLKKLQRKVSLLFPTQKNVLYNILKVSQNLEREKREILIIHVKNFKKVRKNHQLLQRKLF